MKNIVLIGFMGTGKTTNGRRIAKKLNRDFIDTDYYIESENKIKIDELFKRYGEKYFRLLENKAITEISSTTNKVISTGGGTVLVPENVTHLKKNGIIFLLDSSVETICSHLKNSYRKRPLLNKRNCENDVLKLLNERKNLYLSTADYVINVDDKKHYQIVDEIIDIYNESIK